MVLHLSFPDPEDPLGNSNTYVLHPTFAVNCGPGTLFVLTAHDDLRFCHQAYFSDAVVKALGVAGYRFAFVIRWLQLVREFDPSAKHGIVLTPTLEVEAKRRKKEKAKKARRKHNQRLMRFA
jgi:hypothetical protein